MALYIECLVCIEISALYLFIEGRCGAVVDDSCVGSVNERRRASLAEDHLIKREGRERFAQIKVAGVFR